MVLENYITSPQLLHDIFKVLQYTIIYNCIIVCDKKMRGEIYESASSR